MCHIHDTCREKLIDEFEQIRRALNDREEAMLRALDKKYEERDDYLVNQLKLLENHKDKNEDTCERCKEIIATVDIKDISDRESRAKTIHNICTECIDATPTIQSVPIKLDMTFTMDRKRHILDELIKFGSLKFESMESGTHLPFTRLNTTLVNDIKYIGSDIDCAPKNIPLMEISSTSLKFDPKCERQLIVNINCRDGKIR